MKYIKTEIFEKLSLAEKLFFKDLKDIIETTSLYHKINRLKITLHDFTTIYIQYNPYGEYSYSIIFSPKLKIFAIVQRLISL